MLTKKHLEILGVMFRKPFGEFTRKHIKEEAKEKSNNALALALGSLKKEDLLHEKKIGRSGLLRLNMENEKIYQYLALHNSTLMPQVAQIALRRVQEEVEEETSFYSAVIFGSYATGEQKKESDLDIAIFIEDEKRRKHLEACINSAKTKSLIEIDIHVIPKNEMLEMLKSRQENLGKQIARKHVAMHNPTIFYDILKEGIRNGFSF